MTTAPLQSSWSSNLKVTQLRVILSEWTKFRSLRSTRWSGVATVILTIGLSCLFAAVVANHWPHMSPDERANRHPLDIALAGINISQLAVAVLGVLVISGEYSTGMIRASLGAVPKRLPVLWAKIAVFAAAAFVLVAPCILVSFYSTQAILGRHHILQVSIGDPGVLRALLGGAVYVTFVGIMTLGFGAITRNTAGGIASFVALFFVIPPLMNVLPTSWNQMISKYLPSSAGRDVFALTHGAHDLAPWPGFALFAGYTALVVAVAAIQLLRRDV